MLLLSLNWRFLISFSTMLAIEGYYMNLIIRKTKWKDPSFPIATLDCKCNPRSCKGSFRGQVTQTKQFISSVLHKPYPTHTLFFAFILKKVYYTPLVAALVFSFRLCWMTEIKVPHLAVSVQLLLFLPVRSTVIFCLWVKLVSLLVENGRFQHTALAVHTGDYINQMTAVKNKPSRV